MTETELNAFVTTDENGELIPLGLFLSNDEVVEPVCPGAFGCADDNMEDPFLGENIGRSGVDVACGGGCAIDLGIGTLIITTGIVITEAVRNGSDAIIHVMTGGSDDADEQLDRMQQSTTVDTASTPPTGGDEDPDDEDSEIYDRLKAGDEPDRNGLTKAGRALQKHGDKPGSAFPKSTGTATSRNAQGRNVLRGILRSKNKTTTSNRFGGKDIFDNVTGRGARFGGNGNFIGFLEP